MKLIIIRGPSGSGKSTIARHLLGIKDWDGFPAITSGWFEADMYFICYKEGLNPLKGFEYKFDARKLGEAHKWCQDGVRAALQWKDQDKIVVSNTSITLNEANIYIKIANEAKVPYEIIRTPQPWSINELAIRNTHNVPYDTLARHIARYVAVPGEVEWTDMEIFKNEQ